MDKEITYVRDKEIIYVRRGVANVFGDQIELHEDLNLPQFKELKRKILQHELDHDQGKGFIHNLGVDMVPRIPTLKLLKFIIIRPSTWTQVLPFYWHPERKKIIYDKTIMFFWFCIICFLLIIIQLKGGIF